MRYASAVLPVILALPLCALQAQEDGHYERAPQEHDVSCSETPDAQSDSDHYNEGYRDGFKAGCKAAGAKTESSISPDAAVEDHLAPRARDSESFASQNQELLDALDTACARAASKARRFKASHPEGESLRYNISLLSSIVRDPKTCGR